MADEAGTIVLNNPPEEAVENRGNIEVLQPSTGFDLNMPNIVDQDQNQDGTFAGEVMGGEFGE